MKRLSERLSERLAQRDMSRLALEPARPAATQPIGKNLDTSVTCHDSKLRYCSGCDNYKNAETTTLGYLVARSVVSVSEWAALAGEKE